MCTVIMVAAILYATYDQTQLEAACVPHTMAWCGAHVQSIAEKLIKARPGAHHVTTKCIFLGIDA